MVRLLLMAIFIAVILLEPAFAKLKVTADRTVLSTNESFTLEIESDQSGGRPNLSVLEKDFEIISKNHSQNFSIINGKSSRQNIWTVLLMPKSDGQVTIPAIQFGKETSQPIHLVIHKSVNPLKDPKAQNAQNQDVFINISIEPKEQVYVQQQIKLTIQIFTRIGLSNLSLSSINIEDVVLEQIGEDKQFTKIINQQSYQVIERQYAIFPQKSGSLTIPGLQFEAVTVNQRGSNWPFFSNPGKPIRRKSDPISIKVLPKPNNFSGANWLPAEHIQVKSQSTQLDEIKVGDSITITDHIMAQGVLGSLLPQIKFPEINGLKLYPDKPNISSDSYNGKIIGQREEKTAIIATRPGSYHIPDRKISWWNTQTNQMQEETIPGFKIQVLAAQGQSTPEALSLSQPVPENNPVRQSRDRNLPSIPVTTPLLQNPWFWSTLGIGIIYVLSLILFLVWRTKVAHENTAAATSSANDNPKAQQKQLLKELNHYCKNNLAKDAMHSLIQWANLYFHKSGSLKFTSLSDISRKLDDKALAKAIKHLDAAIYAPNQSGQWQGDELLKSLKAFLQAQNKEPSSDPYKLPPLNPAQGSSG